MGSRSPAGGLDAAPAVKVAAVPVKSGDLHAGRLCLVPWPACPLRLSSPGGTLWGSDPRGQSQTGRWETPPVPSEVVQEPKPWPLGNASISPWRCNKSHAVASNKTYSQELEGRGQTKRSAELAPAAGSRSMFARLLRLLEAAHMPWLTAPSALPLRSQPSGCITPSSLGLGPSRPAQRLVTASGALGSEAGGQPLLACASLECGRL